MQSSSTPTAAIILAGGYGTRLQPLTFRVPKPMVPFLNAPMISYQLKALNRIGIQTVMIGVSRLAHCDQLMSYTKLLESELGMTILYAIEDKPLDTGGACIEAYRQLTQYWAEKKQKVETVSRIILCFADVFCSDFELAYRLLMSDEKKGVTMLATRVEDPSRYGVLITEDVAQRCRIKAFIEKPKTFSGTNVLINAGIFSIPTNDLQQLCHAHTTPTTLSLERKIFVDWVKDDNLFCVALPKDVFWIDLGKPSDYLKATLKMLEDSKSGEDVVLGRDVIIKNNTLVQNAIIMDGAVVGENCKVIDSIIGPNVHLFDDTEMLQKVIALDMNDRDVICPL